MILSLTIDELAEYTGRQLNFFFPDKKTVDLKMHKYCIQSALDKIEFCYRRVLLKHYYNGEHVVFNHLYSDHYVMYLWYLSNVLWKETGDKDLCNKVYYFNKALNGIDCMYDTALPDIFLIFHGVGTILGKAVYSDYFVAYQGCTVGINRGKYPVMNGAVFMAAHASLLGDCHVGNNVSISSHTALLDTNINDNIVAFRNTEGALIFQQTSSNFVNKIFNPHV